jgi:hypothetical protein
VDEDADDAVIDFLFSELVSMSPWLYKLSDILGIKTLK